MSDAAILLENFLQALTAGLLVGAIYGVMCVGLGLIFGVMRVINFAQGDFMMLGMYCSLYVIAGLGLQSLLGPSVAPFVGALLAGPALFVGGYLLHKYLVSRVTGIRAIGAEGDGHYAQLILTLGVALVLENGGLIVFGSEPQSIRTPLSSRAWEIGPLLGDDVSVFLNQARGYSFVLAIVIGALLYLFISRTRLGKTLRAAADNPNAAIYMGIDVDNAHRVAFALGSAITAVAGGLVAISNPFQPYAGLDYVIIMYAGVVLGGMGSILGAFWGGMTIGLVQQLSTLVLSPQLQNAAIFGIFLLIVFLRPQGLFGRSAERT